MNQTITKTVENPKHMQDMLAIVSRRGTPRKLDEYQQAIIAQVVEATCDLMVNNYKDMDNCRKDNKTASCSANIHVTIGWDQGSAKVNTSLAFAKGYRDKREDIVGDPKQTKMFNNEGQAVVEEKKSKKGKK